MSRAGAPWDNKFTRVQIAKDIYEASSEGWRTTLTSAGAYVKDHGQQRLRRAARVDDHRLAVRLVPDEIGVGEPVLLHGALDDHGRAEPSMRLEWRSSAPSSPSSSGSPI